MLRALLVASAFALGSCTLPDRPAEPIDDAEEAVSLTVSPLVGTFAANPASAGDFSLLTIKRDGTYHAEKLVQCVAAPCPPIGEDGTWRLDRRPLDTLLVLNHGRQLTNLRYKFRGDWLSLQPVSPESAWQALQRQEEAWCETPRDCEMQNLTAGPCSGRWRCKENACAYVCGRPRPVE